MRLKLYAAAGLILLSAMLIASDRSQPSPRPPSSDPFHEHVLSPNERSWLSGRVEARLHAGSYVYLRVREPHGSETWLVSLAATTPADERVRALVLGRAEHFRSRRLERDFSPLLFAAVRGEDEKDRSR